MNIWETLPATRFDSILMKAKLLRQPWLTLLTHAFFALVTIAFYHSIQESNSVDHATVDIYEIYGFFVIGLLFILTMWAAVSRKKVVRYMLCGLFLIANVWLYFFGLDKIKNLPYQQRFVLKNDTPYTLTDLKIIGDTVIELGTLQPNQKTKATYENYVENSSIDMTCMFGQQKDTVNLVAGLTNSIGYFNIVSIKVQSDKLKADISQ